MKFKYFLIIYIFLFVSPVFSQVSEEQEELIEAAKELFEDGEYQKAMPLFSQLLSIYPSEAIYSYYYGACLVENNKEIDKAIKYLSYGARKLTDQPLVYYYLGSAYHLSYQFDKAIAQYQIFQTKSVAKQQREKQIEREIAICNNGLTLVKYSSPLIVLENKRVKQNNFQYSYNLNQIGGKLVVKPDQFKTKADIKRNAKELIFISDSGQVFFSSLGDKKNGDRNIYWTEKNAEGEFIPSKNIGDSINTPFDEDYPFLKADGKTLYFCSKGHNTMGGYDIFKTIYDSTSGTWSTPINLDFPTNTPYDDILYVVDADDKLAYFSSNRESQEQKLNVYKIQVDNNPVERELKSIEEIQNLAKLQVTPLADRAKQTEANVNEEKKLAVTEVSDYKSESLKTDFSFDEVYKNNVATSKDYTTILRQDLVQLTNNLSKTELKSILASNIAHNKVGKLRELQSQIETRENALSEEEQQSDAELQKLRADLIKTNTQAFISAKASEALFKEIEVRKREIKITEMLLNDSSNNNKQELVQNINANRQFLQQNNKSYLSIRNWTREKEREKVLVEQRLEQKQQEFNKANVKFDRTLVSYQEEERKFKAAKEAAEITEAKKDLDIAKEDLLLAQNEAVESKLVLAEEKALLEKMEEEIIFLNTINSEISNIQNQQLARENQSLDHKLIIKNAKELNESVLAMQLDESAFEVQKTYDEKTAEIFSSEELLGENNTEEGSFENTEAKNTEINVEKNIGEELAVTNSLLEDDSSKSDSLAVSDSLKRHANESIEKEQLSEVSKENISNDDIAKVDLIQVYSLDARIKYSKSKYDAQLSDSLISLAKEKEQRVNYIPNAEQQQIVRDEIDELKQLSQIKSNQSKQAYAEAKLIEEKFISENKPDTIVESLIKQKLFAFESTQDESPELIEYKKAAFKEQYFQQELARLEVQKKRTERTLDEQELSVESREEFQADLKAQIQREKEIQTLLYDAKETQEEMKEVLIANNETYPISRTEVYAAATKTRLSNQVELSETQEKSLKISEKNREDADVLIVVWTSKIDEIKVLEDSLTLMENKGQKKKLSNLIIEKKASAWEDYKKANELQQFANMEEANVLESLLNINRRYQGSDEKAQAAVFEKESGLLMQKAFVLRESVKPSEEYDPATAKILDEAQKYETISINRKKSALDLYVSMPKDSVNNNELVSNNTTKQIEKETQFGSGAVDVELLPDEEEIIADYKKEYSQAESKRIKAESYEQDVEDSKEKLDRTFAKKDQEKLESKIEKQQLKAGLVYHEAYLIQQEANKKKYNLYTRKLENVMASSADEKRKSIAKQYILDAEFYYEEAQKIQVDSLQAINELKTTQTKRLDLQQEALDAQELAYLSLTKDENTDFLTVGTLVKIDPLESNEKPIDKSIIEKVQTHRIINRIELTPKEVKQLEKGEKLKDEQQQLTEEYLETKELAETLKDSLPKITDPKQWKKADAEISDLDTKSLSYLFSIAQTTEPINYDKYMLYKNHVKEYRIKGRGEDAVTGRALEKDANKAFRKAQNLRARSFEVVSVDRAYEMLQQAEVLEKQALEDMEKAYTIYMNLGPLDEDVDKYIAENTDTNTVGIHGNILIESEADVEEIKTPDITSESLLVETEEINQVVPEIKPDSIDLDLTEEVMPIDTITPQVIKEDAIFVEEITKEPEQDKEELAVEEIKEPKVEDIAEARSLLDFKQKSIYSKQNPIPINEPLPSGIVYKIQIGAFTRPIPQNSFRGLTPITGEARQNSKYIRYFVGLFNTYDAANTALPYIKSSGYKDAFVVAYKDGQRVAVYIAKAENKQQPNYSELAEKETKLVLQTVNLNSNNSSTVVENNVNPSVNLSTVGGAMYTVQIGAYKTHVSHSRLKNLSPLYNDVNSSGLIRYFVGKYSDYNEALKRKAEIRKLGIKDAFVTAFKDGKKITINQARKELADIEQVSVSKEEAILVQEESTEQTNVASSVDVENLYYRVQIGAYSKTVPVKVVSSFVQMSKLDQLDRFENSDGKTVYTIGQFKSLSQANTLKQDLIENGILDAFVIAYDGKVKIKIVEAQKLLNP